MPTVWPFTPLHGVTESLEWKTDILQSRDGEQRIQTRSSPRRILQMAHILGFDADAQAMGLLRGNLTGEWTVSIWPKRSGSDAPPTETAILATQPRVDRTTPKIARYTVSFLAAATSETAATLATHRSSPVVPDASVISSPLSEGIGQIVEYVDSGRGLVQIEAAQSYVQARRTLRFIDVSAEDRTARRAMIYALRGRQQSFWIVPRGPLLKLAAPITAAGTSITISAAGTTTDHVGRSIAILHNGVAYYREVTAASDSGANQVLTISALGADVPVTARAAWMLLVRSDADTIETEHFVTHSQVEFPVIEVPA